MEATEDATNKVAANAGFFVGVIPEYLKCIAIKPIQAIFGTEPKETFFILDTTYDCIIRKTILDLEMAEIV